MDERILPAAILADKTKPLIGIVPFDRADTFLGRPYAGLAWRRGHQGQGAVQSWS
jgi:hypothetical protein